MEPPERYRSIVDDFEAFQAACQRPLPSAIRVNTIKSTVEEVRQSLSEAGINAEPVDWHDQVFVLPDDSAGANWPYFHGWIHGQEEVSTVPATILDPQPGERVWDACGAPGSKTTQLAAQMDDRGEVVATDNNLGRIAALRSNTERLGATNVAVTHEDARNHSLKPFGGSEYDRALVDVPCSCEGTIRKNPDAFEDWSRSHVKGVSTVQEAILARAVQATRPGGTVVYSTCTFAPEENEAVLDAVLGSEACDIVPFDLSLAHRSGVTEWQGSEYDPRVQSAKRIYPHHNDTGGFFCAKLEVTA
jgi:NOL1/NOP2/sun family putative RNA methylase